MPTRPRTRTRGSGRGAATSIPRRLAVLLLLALLAACQSGGSGERDVLVEEPSAAGAYAPPEFADVPAAELPEEGVRLEHPGPAEGGTSYRLVAEWGGEQEFLRNGEREGEGPRRDARQIEIEFRELPVEAPGGADGAYVLVLDGLHFELRQQRPATQREIEIYDDRLRIMQGKEKVLDLRGAQPRERLTPRMLLGKVFAVVAHDRFGNPVHILPRGPLAARDSLEGLPVREVIAYSRLALPGRTVPPGATWGAKRFPANPVGQLGLPVEIEYTLVGFQRVQGVRAAWLVLEASREAEDVPSELGLRFDRVRATIEGHAWVDLETSRVLRLLLEDDVRASYTRGDEERSVTHRLRYQGRLLLEARDPGAHPQKWADGSERFGERTGG